MTRARQLVAASTIALLGTSLLSTVSAAPGLCPSGDGVVRRGDWAVIDVGGLAPVAGGAPFVVDYAADPAGRGVLLATDGNAVVRSGDDGCSWDVTLSSDPLPAEEAALAGKLRFDTLALRRTPEGALRAYALASEQVAGAVSRPVLFASDDGGTTWRRGGEGLPPGSPLHMEVARADANYVVLSVETPGVGQALFQSYDGGASWTQSGNAATAATNPPPRLDRFALDPFDPSTMWVYSASSTDRLQEANYLFKGFVGGLSFQPVEEITAGVAALDIYRPSADEPARIMAFAHSPGYWHSEDGGDNWFTSENLPRAATSVAHGSKPGDLVISTGEDDEESVYALDEDAGQWVSLTTFDFPALEDLTTDMQPEPVLYARSGGSIYRYEGSIVDVQVPPVHKPNLLPPSLSANPDRCPPPPPPAPWQPGWDPVPANQGPVYATNFDNGYTIRYDAKGTGTVVAVAPQYTEGIAIDPLGRVIATTRFSNALVRLDPVTCRLEALDFNAFYAEAPTFDLQGNLFIVDTNNYYVWEYPWPQTPRMEPKLVKRMPGFLEDVKVAPPESPFAGDLFVLYRDRRHQVDDRRVCQGPIGDACAKTQGNPNAIAILHRNDDGTWEQREEDFANFSATEGEGFRGKGLFESAGMAFMPDGSLLVPQICCDGIIRRYAPDGESFTEFARVPRRSPDVPSVLYKITTTPDGYVYATGATTADGTSNADESGEAMIVRFDPAGNRMLPDFGHNLTVAVGVAVPQRTNIVNVPPDPDPPLVEDPEDPPVPPARPELPVRGAPVVPPGPPPPIPPLPVPAPGVAPAVQMAPAPANAPAAAQAAQPNAAMLHQQQEQPQVSLVHAAQSLREQLGGQHAMTRLVARRRDPLDAARHATGAAALAVVAFALSLGFATRRREQRVTWR